ncbi:hypothetical protein [Neptunomonas japonica]|uniref:Uncharacterized protein n=1 Tax=Neptunomonas japonica JAMM 1380 TaxID=1441457 RepID=A0A7R6PLD7_9GAMM|nr:hypothetical protein [Neptunomonas japonica]BBB31266.1 conserved hypothetical protein [Neptunomonas japonica JAMM 1380]
MINLASLSFYFDVIEDRIRLIGNLDNGQQRVDFWLTRRLVLKLLEASPTLVKQTSEKISKTPLEHQSAMAQFEHDSAKQSQSVRQEANLEHNDFKASLLRRLDISFQKGQYRLSFYVGNQDEVFGFSVLTHQEMHQILHWMHKGCLQLDWGVSVSLFDINEQAPMRLQ